MRLAKIMSFEQFAAQMCASRQDFGDAGLHRSASHISRRTWESMVDAQARKDNELAERRVELRAEYQRLVAEGHIIEPTPEHRLTEAAKGETAQAAAARRILAKRESLRKAKNAAE